MTALRVFGCLGRGGGGIGCSLHRRLSGVCGTEQLTASDEGASGSGRLRTHTETLFQHDRNASGGEASSRRALRPRRDTQRRQATQKWADSSEQEHEQRPPHELQPLQHQHQTQAPAPAPAPAAPAPAPSGSITAATGDKPAAGRGSQQGIAHRLLPNAGDSTNLALAAAFLACTLRRGTLQPGVLVAHRPFACRQTPTRARPLCCMTGDRRSLGRV